MELILGQVAVTSPVSQPKKANLLLGCVQTRVLVVTLRRHLGERLNVLGSCDTLWLVLKVAKKDIRRCTVPLVGSRTDQRAADWRALFRCSRF